MKISFIVCCYNSEKRIPITLKAIFKATSMNDLDWELVVVNNCSNDNTREIIEKVASEYGTNSFKIVDEAIPGLMSARLKGASVASGDYLSFIDDDNEIAINWLFEVRKAFLKYPNAGIVGGLATCCYNDLPFWFDDFQGSFACGHAGRTEGLINGLVNYGAGMTIKAKAWNEISNKLVRARNLGRRSGDFGSNDDELIHILIRNLKYDIVYEPRLKLIHNIDHSRLNWEHLLNMKMGFGVGFVRMNKFLIFNSGQSYLYHILKLLKCIIKSVTCVISFSLKNIFNKRIKSEGSASYLEFVKSLGRLKGLIS